MHRIRQVLKAYMYTSIIYVSLGICKSHFNYQSQKLYATFLHFSFYLYIYPF